MERHFFMHYFISSMMLICIGTLAHEPSIHLTNGNQAVHNNYSPDTKISVNLVNLVEITTLVSTKIKTLFNDCKHVMIDQDYKKICKLLKNWLWEKKYTIGLYSTGSLYGLFSSYLFLEYFFYSTNKNLWAHWKSDCTFEQLCEIEQKALARELILSIQMHNLDLKNPTNFAQPLITFIYSIDCEIKRIKRYIAIAQTLYHSPLGVIFPTNEKKINYARILLERTQFVRHIFLSWLAEYNFIHNT